MNRLTIVAVAVALAVSAAAAQDLDRLFKTAVNTETVDRNCTAAIEQYKKVAAGSDRALAAQALVRMAGCYQQIGDAEAQRVYERIVREYSDQADAVAVARTRLANYAAPERLSGDRVVKSGPGTTDGEGRVSPDGRFISYVSWGGPKGLNLMLHDLVNNTERAITDVDWNGGAAYDSTFSPDGKQLAYGWSAYDQSGREVRVVTLESPGSLQPRTIYKSQQYAVVPTDWSRDGQTLAVRVSQQDGTEQVALLGIDGSLRVLKTVDNWRGVNKIFFSPDGKYLAYDITASDTDRRRDVYIIAADGSGEAPVHDAADDVVMGWAPDGRHLLFASDRSGRVDLWAMLVSNGRPASTPPVLVKRDIGAVEPQGLTASGTLYAVKDASTVNVQVAPVDLEGGTLTGPPVLQIFRTETPAWSPDGKFLAYQARGPSGQAHLAVREVASNRVRELHPPLVYMPQPQWFPDGRSLMIAGRDLKGRNTTLLVDVETGQETVLPRGGDLSPDGKKVYFAIAPANRSGRVVEQDLATGAQREIFVKPDATGAPRLSPDGRWIAAVKTPAIDSKNPSGRTSTVIFASVADAAVRELVVPAVLETYRGLDWTPDSQSLLVAATAPEHGLWLVPINGSAPRKFAIDTGAWYPSMGIRLHPNGKQIAYFTGEDGREVWALENVLPTGGR